MSHSPSPDFKPLENLYCFLYVGLAPGPNLGVNAEPGQPASLDDPAVTMPNWQRALGGVREVRLQHRRENGCLDQSMRKPSFPGRPGGTGRDRRKSGLGIDHRMGGDCGWNEKGEVCCCEGWYRYWGDVTNHVLINDHAEFPDQPKALGVRRSAVTWRNQVDLR